MQNNKTKIVEILWLIIALGLFIASIWLIRNGELEAMLSGLGLWAPLAIIILKISTLVIAPLGGNPLYIIAGALYGKLWGFIICFVGDVLGSSICFAISRKYGERIVRTLAGEKYFTKIKETVGILDNTKSFIKARIGFISVPEILSYAAGLSRINFWKFSFINALFYVPVDLALVFLGSTIADLSVKHFFIIPALAFVFALLGFGLLAKDYEKTG